MLKLKQMIIRQFVNQQCSTMKLSVIIANRK